MAAAHTAAAHTASPAEDSNIIRGEQHDPADDFTDDASDLTDELQGGEVPNFAGGKLGYGAPASTPIADEDETEGGGRGSLSGRLPASYLPAGMSHGHRPTASE